MRINSSSSFFQFIWLSMQLVSRVQRQYSLLLWNITKAKTNKTRCQDGSCKSRKGWPCKRVGGLRSEQPQGMALKEWSFTTRLRCNSNGWIDHVRRWFSALWRSVLCHLAGLKALQKRPAEAKGWSSENGRALAQGYSPGVAQSEDSFSSQGWSRKRSQVGDIQDRCTCCSRIYALPISREGLQPLEIWNCQSFESSFCHRHLLDLRRWAQRWRWMRSPLACQRVSCLQMRLGGACLWVVQRLMVMAVHVVWRHAKYSYTDEDEGRLIRRILMVHWLMQYWCLGLPWPLELRKTKKQRRKDQRRNIQVWDLGINKGTKT